MNEKDQIIQNLIKVAEEKKREISKIEKPTWKTNCSFKVDNNSNATFNLKVVSGVTQLSEMLGMLVRGHMGNLEAHKLLGLDVTEIQYNGFSYEDWVSDFISRKNILLVSQEKAKLTVIQNRLYALTSAEMKEKLELEAITKELEL